MKRIAFSMWVLFIVLATSCNQGSNQNSKSTIGSGGERGQENFDPETIANRQVEQLNEALNLSKEQQKQIHDVMIESFENMQKVREDLQKDGGDFSGMREQMQKMREDQNEKMRSILSDEQWQKYQDYQQEMRSKRGQGGTGGFGGPGRRGQN